MTIILMHVIIMTYPTFYRIIIYTKMELELENVNKKYEILNYSYEITWNIFEMLIYKFKILSK